MCNLNSNEKVGLWLVGARGSIGVMTIAALLLNAESEKYSVGMITNRQDFHAADLISLKNIVISGHDIHNMPLMDTARRLWKEGSLDGDLESVMESIHKVEADIKYGVCTDSIQNDIDAIKKLRNDFDEFKYENNISKLIVINVSSTEFYRDNLGEYSLYNDLLKICSKEQVLTESCLYACATFEGGDAYIDFTPSQVFSVPAIIDLANQKKCLYMGSDGKTGETLLKSVLVELFKRRNFKIDSWFGQNILGNKDGETLSNTKAKTNKIKSKEYGLHSVFGKNIDAHVGIDYVRSLGEWKIAWDYIGFTGFLGCKMNFQFTWTGYDSVLACPLVIDLARLTELAMRRGEEGAMYWLSSFFKSPYGVKNFELVAQDEALIKWINFSD